MRHAIDHHTARPTNSFAAVVIEGNRLAALDNEPLVHDVEHLQKRHVRTDVSRRVGDETSFRVKRRLPPHMKLEIHESARSPCCARSRSSWRITNQQPATIKSPIDNFSSPGRHSQTRAAPCAGSATCRRRQTPT